MANLIQKVTDSIPSTNEQTLVNSQLSLNDEFNWWIVFASIEFLLIVFLLIKLLKTNREQSVITNGFDELRKAKSNDIDMTNLMNSINSSRVLYKELSRKCHPDRFQDEMIKRKADIIFQDISRHKRDHTRLTELKQLAEKELNINF
ncbi:MAG: molecular chaperone DnaJ [Flavobacteriaceae bacterium]|nr:molecular chaperone DnaJ [Flavobacteriaceae bacterium]